MTGMNSCHEHLETLTKTPLTMTSLVGLVRVGMIKMASVGTAPVFPVLVFCPFIQPRWWENSLSLMMRMSSPFLKRRNVGSSVKEEVKQWVHNSEKWKVIRTLMPWPCVSPSFSATAYCDRSVRPLRNIVTNSAMSSAVDALRVKSPFSVSRLTVWPDPFPCLSEQRGCHSKTCCM